MSRTIAQTPAPKEDRVHGSDLNKSESSKDVSSAKSIKFDKKTLDAIKNKVQEHNEEHPDKKINLASAKAVVRRGMGAYSKSHRPTITGGKPNSRVAWGLARLNAFTYKIVHGKSKSGKYSQDDDLIEDLGYNVSKLAKGSKLDKTGDCYLVSGRIVLELSNKEINYIGTPYLVHAEVQHSQLKNIRYGHAFIEDDVFVYDFSNGRELVVPKQLYYHFGDINPKDEKKYRKYTFKEAKKKMYETENFGCWDLDVEYSKGGDVGGENALKAKKVADEAESKIIYLECDGATRVLHYLFQEQNISHVVKKGSVTFGKENIPFHFWIELPDGNIVDYKSRMWLGEKAQQGVFKPSSKTEYLGKEIDLKVSKFIYEILTMNKGGFIEEPSPEYLKMFLGF